MLRTAKPLPNGTWALGFFFLQLLINLFFVIMHSALYKDLISYVHVIHDLESLVKSILINNSSELQISEIFLLESSNRSSEGLLDWKAVFSVSNERSRTCEKESPRRVLSGDLKEFPGVLSEATSSDHYSSCVKSYNKQQLRGDPSHPHTYNIMAKITKKPWSIQYTDSQYENQEFDLEDVNLEKLDPKALNTYIIDFIYIIKLTNSMNTALLCKF
jgi:hypothetical protein